MTQTETTASPSTDIARRMLIQEVDDLARALRTIPGLAHEGRLEMEGGGIPRLAEMASAVRSAMESHAKITTLCQVLGPLGDKALGAILAGERP